MVTWRVVVVFLFRIRSITREVAAAVVKQAVEEDVAEGYQKMEARHLRAMTEVRGGGNGDGVIDLGGLVEKSRVAKPTKLEEV